MTLLVLHVNLLVLAAIVLLLLHAFEALGIRRANEVRLHIVDATIGVHQVLHLLALDLNHSHHDAIDHVHTFAIVRLTYRLLLC